MVTALPSIVAAVVEGGERKRSTAEGMVSPRLPAPETAPEKPSPEQKELGPGWNHVVRVGRVVKTQSKLEPIPKPSGTKAHRETVCRSGQPM